MASLHGIALASEIPAVRIGVGPEIPQVRIACQKCPLRVHSAAGKDVGDEVAGIALRFQSVIGAIGALPIHAFHTRKPGKVRKGFQLNGEKVHLALLWKIGVRIGGQKLPGGVRIVSLRRFNTAHCNAVEKGIDKSLGEIELRGGPAVDIIEILRFVVPVYSASSN